MENKKVYHIGKIIHIRDRRAKECFPIINRGELWYNTLTDEQLDELREWYHNWLDATETLSIPNKPEWII
jgi:hypothetical protein